MFSWITPPFTRLVAWGVGLQTFCWYLGHFEECTACVKAYKSDLYWLIPLYLIFSALFWDRPRVISQRKVRSQIKGQRKGKGRK